MLQTMANMVVEFLTFYSQLLSIPKCSYIC